MGSTDSLGRSARVVALEKTTFLLMYCVTFRAGLAESMTLPRNLAEILSRRLRLTNANLVSLVILDMPRRVASQLLALPNEYGQQTPESLWIPIKPTLSC
jgi:CRP-like cAMP-binding protein